MMGPLRERAGALYAALIIAAIVVILFSVIGIAIMTDMLPHIELLQASVTKTQRR